MPLVMMVKEMTSIYGLCSAVGHTGSGRMQCASSMQELRCSFQLRGSNMAIPLEVSGKFMACPLLIITTIGKQWKESSSNPVWTLQSTMSSELPEDPIRFILLQCSEMLILGLLKSPTLPK